MVFILYILNSQTVVSFFSNDESFIFKFRIGLIIVSLLLIYNLFVIQIPLWENIFNIKGKLRVILSPAYLVSLVGMIFLLLTFLPINIPLTGKNYKPNLEIIFIVFLGIIFFIIGSIISLIKKDGLPKRNFLYFLKDKKYYLFYVTFFILWFIGILAGIYAIFSKGVPILKDNINFFPWVNPFVNGLLELQIFGVFLLNKIRNKLFFMVVLISPLILFLKGTRYQFMFILLAMLLYLVYIGKFKLKYVITFGIIGLILTVGIIGVIKHNDINENYSSLFDNQISLVLFEIYSSSVSTFKNLERLITQIMPGGYFYGSSWYYTMYVLFPYHQEPFTIKLSDLVLNNFSGYGNTQSLHFSSWGYMLSDFGYISLVAYSILFGYFISIFYRYSLKSNIDNEIYLASYSILISAYLLGIPTTVFRATWLSLFILFYCLFVYNHKINILDLLRIKK